MQDRDVGSDRGRRLAAVPLLPDLAQDIRGALRSPAVWLFLLFQAGAGSFILARRGPDFAPFVALVWAGCFTYGIFVWFAGRVPRAHAAPDPVRAPRAEGLAVAVVALGVVGWMFAVPGSLPLAAAGLAAWLAAFLTGRYRVADFRWLTRSWLPFAPLLLAVALPKLYLGPALITNTLGALQSGVVQQLLLQVGVTARFEALTGRSDVAAVAAALVFGAAHTPLDLPQAGGDWSLALANALLLQGTIGLLFCLGYLRHRAPLALGGVHALAMA